MKRRGDPRTQNTNPNFVIYYSISWFCEWLRERGSAPVCVGAREREFRLNWAGEFMQINIANWVSKCEWNIEFILVSHSNPIDRAISHAVRYESSTCVLHTGGKFNLRSMTVWIPWISVKIANRCKFKRVSSAPTSNTRALIAGSPSGEIHYSAWKCGGISQVILSSHDSPLTITIIHGIQTNSCVSKWRRQASDMIATDENTLTHKTKWNETKRNRFSGSVTLAFALAVSVLFGAGKSNITDIKNSHR